MCCLDDTPINTDRPVPTNGERRRLFACNSRERIQGYLSTRNTGSWKTPTVWPATFARAALYALSPIAYWPISARRKRGHVIRAPASRRPRDAARRGALFESRRGFSRYPRAYPLSDIIQSRYRRRLYRIYDAPLMTRLEFFAEFCTSQRAITPPVDPFINRIIRNTCRYAERLISIRVPT